MIIPIKEDLTIKNQFNKDLVIKENIIVDRVVDRPNDKVVRVFIKDINTPFILWEKEDYDNIGQWTDQDVISKLKEKFNIKE